MRITGSIHPLAPSKTFRPQASTSDSFLESKRDKRIIKHSSFLSRITTSSSGVSKSKKRSRRPGNKLAATLDGLADALPELDDAEDLQDGKVRHKSLKSKRGALKRKERIVKGEMERFGVSMAQLANTPAPRPTPAQQQVAMDLSGEKKQEGNAATPATANRWAALRGYISATMEQNPAFTNRQ
ncbi:hypothetical protein PT974_10044 [Cladobotryum mycophilum]|uniref:Ribosome biogenesis protein SLX9 n=1 Tax=Cladobotryum mycophilum TaxID=491253 RepID=A0ABR0S9U7_9HYPO